MTRTATLAITAIFCLTAPVGARYVLLAEFQARASKLNQVRGDCFGEVTQGGPLGQYATWPEMMAAFSAFLIEDAKTLGAYPAGDMALIRQAHRAGDAQLHRQQRQLNDHAGDHAPQRQPSPAAARPAFADRGDQHRHGG